MARTHAPRAQRRARVPSNRRGPALEVAAALVGLLLFSAPGLARAQPDPHRRPAATRSGLAGTLRVRAAELDVPHTFGVATTGEFLRHGGLVVEEDEVARWAGTIAGRYALLDWLGLAGSFEATSTGNSETDPSLLTSTGDLELLAQAVHPIDEWLVLGLGAGVQLFAEQGQPFPAGDATSLPVYALASMPRLGSSPLHVHFNLGYTWDNSANAVRDGLGRGARFALGVREDSYWSLGAAVEADLGRFWPYVEYTTEQAINEDLDYGASPGADHRGHPGPPLRRLGAQPGHGRGRGRRAPLPRRARHTRLQRAAPARVRRGGRAPQGGGAHRAR